MDFYEAFGFQAALHRAIERFSPILRAATTHGLAHDAALAAGMVECRAALSKAMSETASESDLRQAIDLVNRIGPQLLIALNPGGRA